jgi:hypothetical protein
LPDGCTIVKPHVFEAAKTQLTGQGKPQGNSKSQAALFLIFAFMGVGEGGEQSIAWCQVERSTQPNEADVSHFQGGLRIQLGDVSRIAPSCSGSVCCGFDCRLTLGYEL